MLPIRFDFAKTHLMNGFHFLALLYHCLLQIRISNTIQANETQTVVFGNTIGRYDEKLFRRIPRCTVSIGSEERDYPLTTHILVYEYEIYVHNIGPNLQLTVLWCFVAVCHSAVVLYYRFLPGARLGDGSWLPFLLVTFAFAYGFGCVSGR